MYSILKRLANHPQSFVRFCMVGAVNTGIDFGLFLALHYGADWTVTPSHITSFSAATANSYLMNRYWTFGPDRRTAHRRQLPRFLMIAVGGLTISSVAIWILAQHMPGWVAKLAVIALTLAWNYLGSVLFVFRKPSSTRQ